MKLLSIISFSLLTFISSAQTEDFFQSQRFQEIITEVFNRPFNPNNTREGETNEYCLQHTIHAALMQDPEYQALVAEKEAQMAAQGPVDAPKATVYYIPVVFHLLHNNGPEFISDDQIMDAFEILNRDYALLNADATAVEFEFNATNPAATAVPAAVDIQFRLATLAPNGACFSGITHTVSPIATNATDFNQISSTVRNNNDVYQGQWAGDKYLNIYITDDIGNDQAAAYTFTPFSGWTTMDNGVYARHTYVGSFGTGNPNWSRTLTHEVGHWLNLEHTWGGSNDPGLAANCDPTSDDGVDDTPECIGLTSCNLNANTCALDNAYWGYDAGDNTENYMEYSYCDKMFTQGQVDRMRNTILVNQSWNANRDNLITGTNLALTGATGAMTLCRAEFSASQTAICVGDQIQFTDETYNAANGWTWTFTGGTPSSSSAQNPTVTYNTPGVYQVVLTATDGVTNDTETKAGYIRVMPSIGAAPILEGFESYTTLLGLEEWDVIDYGNNVGFEITTTAGHTGTKSAKLANMNQAAGNVDELASAPIDLSAITAATDMTMSFRYSYRQRNAANDEWLKVQVTNDCGETWVTRKTIHGTFLSDIVNALAWTPTSAADWTTVHMANVTSTYWVDNFRYKFRFESDGGNNFYLDNINIYAGAASNDLVVGLEEIVELENLTLFPNPADDELNVRFGVKSAQFMNFAIQDITGKVVQNLAVNASEGTNLVMLETQELASGMYFLNITSGGQSQTIQFVVK